MYVCICNAINERKVDEAIAGGAQSVSRIYKHNGCVPKCGKCVPLMRERLGRCIAEVLMPDNSGPALLPVPVSA